MILLTDLDHTICDAAWRDHLMPDDHVNGDWTEYFKAGENDQPIYVVMSIVRHFCKMPTWSVIGVTARDELWRQPTLLWLRTNGVVLEDLLMRPVGDHTPTAELKVKMVTDHIWDLSQVAAVIEDRADCVEAFKAIGLNVIQYHDCRRMNEHK